MNDHPPSVADRVATLRPHYQTDLAAGTERFFEPRRTRCPWCDGPRLQQRLRTPDLVQHKPGRFVLDRCLDCGHVFQNPRLSAAGLEFYYRDLYDGLGEEAMGKALESNPQGLRSRAELVAAHHRPARWLDVGTGHGHFCREAASVFPDTEFHGLDMSKGAELAQSEGWVSKGFRGSFIDMEAELASTYDVISMFHYLEHASDPKAELAAAAEMLDPGSFLVIELPDPESRWGRLLGKYWLPWLQPQHLHLMPISNLLAAAEQFGFTVVEQQREEPHWPVDLMSAVLLWRDARFGVGDVPWKPKPPGTLRRLWHKFGKVATLLPLMLAKKFDDRFASHAREHGYSNAYRALLQRD